MLNAQQFLNQFSLEAPLDESLYPIIRDICQEVKVHGDKALKMYNLTFDHTKTDHLEISHEQIKAAFDTLDEKTKQALQQSYERIKAYQESIKQTNQQLEESVECYEIYHPLESVGIYVPGGKASYPSTVLMTATLAQVAGVENIVVVTPPQPNGVSQEVLAACYITQVNQVFQVGGAQSIAALTYGTETIPKVDKIVGPGNQFVAYAKKYLFGQVGIDQIAGPTEIALIIDDTTDLDAIVYDVFAQAEHDELARTYVISEDAQVLKDLESRIAKALPNVDRYDIVSKSIANQHYLIHASNFDEACHVMNTIAPEHASIQTVNPQPYIEKVKYVGALFIGHYSPEVIGDYVAGPSHVLPTNRTARFTNGLSVNDFLTRNTVIHLSKDTFEQIADSAYEQFKEAYAKFYGLSPEQIIAGNGSDELIQKLMLIMSEGPALTLNPDFFMYQAYAAQVNREIAFVDAGSDLTFDLETILTKIDEVQPSFFIMSNPHNPSGKQFDTAFLTAIADKMKALNGYFVIDEAYLDYGTAYDVELAPHILRMRTLSKAFGIAGLRLGVLISTAGTIKHIQKIEHPYPLNVFTLNIATYIFRHREETSRFLTMQRQLAEQLKQIFDTHVADKISVFPSNANFVLTKGSAAQQLGQYVYEQGFKPRFYDEPVMKGYVRYSIATEPQLNQLEEIVKEWSAKYDLSKTTKHS